MSMPVLFDSYNLEASVPGLIIISVDPYRFPKRELTVDHIANTDKSVMSGAYYQDKKINVVVEIGRDDYAQLQDSLDALNLILQGEEKPLIFPYGSSTRKWIATLSNIAATDVKGGHGEFNIEFECANGIGVDIVSTPIFSESLSGGSWTKDFVLGGSAKWQQPQLTVTYSALTGGTNKTVTVGNPATGQSVSINRDFVLNDVLLIDSVNKRVTVNGTEVPHTGVIPEWARGPGSMTYTDDFTSRIQNPVAIYTKRHI